jgi:hypothetical protein
MHEYCGCSPKYSCKDDVNKSCLFHCFLTSCFRNYVKINCGLAGSAHECLNKTRIAPQIKILNNIYSISLIFCLNSVIVFSYLFLSKTKFIVSAYLDPAAGLGLDYRAPHAAIAPDRALTKSLTFSSQKTFLGK